MTSPVSPGGVACPGCLRMRSVEQPAQAGLLKCVRTLRRGVRQGKMRKKDKAEGGIQERGNWGDRVICWRYSSVHPRKRK